MMGKPGAKSMFMLPISYIAALIAQGILLLRKAHSPSASKIADDLTPFVGRIVALRDRGGLRRGEE
jgi:hypothetical protein